MKAVFLRALEAEDKREALLEALGCQGGTLQRKRFDVETGSFSDVPGSPFAYWVSERLRRLFVEVAPFAVEGRTAKVGLQTSDDFRFARSWWSIKPSEIGRTWFCFAKGGTFAAFYADVPLVVNWARDGQLMKAWAGSLYDNSHWSRILKNTDFFFRPGLRWTRTALGFVRKGMGMSVLPEGCVFNDKSCSVFVQNNQSGTLTSLLAIMSSSCVDRLVRVLTHSRSWELGHILAVPIPATNSAHQSTLASLARRAWSLKRSLDTRTETSHVFALPALLQVPGDSLAVRAAAWAERVRLVEGELAAIQAEIDTRCFDLYGIDEAERRAIVEGFGAPATESADDDKPELEDGADTEVAETDGADTASLAAELISWAVGVAFGRFDVRLATGERSAPPEPNPFDPLPVCSPGMITGDDGLPLAEPPPGYPLGFPADGVLVDDPGHPRDLTAAVRAAIDVVFGADADARWCEAAELLDPKGHDLRAWVSGSLFEHHLKRYSKSRRKAPILWQLATPSGSYAVWLYAHRLTNDTFFHVQNEYVAPKLAHEERKLAALVRDGGENPTAVARKAIDRQETFVEELRALKEEVARVAPLWNPDLNDGVLLTMAPLWRLVPQHRAWQKELKSAWDSLCAGEYDWAHVAMHLWPERVVPKCATDRSLAIAHGVEDVFWVEAAGSKWQPRRKPLRPVEELVRERTSPAVKAALESLQYGQGSAGPAGGRRAPGRDAVHRRSL